jgi:ketosteroid isomerase-like protein
MTLEDRVRRIEDIEEIRGLRFQYHQFINDGHFDRFTELFTDDADVKLDYFSHFRGKKEIEAGFSGIPGKVDILLQFTHNHMVDVQGDRATGLSYFEARYGKEGTSYLVAGRYDEVYVRQADRWLIKSTDVKIYFSVPLQEGWMGNDRHHLRPAEKAA